MELIACPFCKGEYIDIALERSFYSGIVISYVYCSCGAQGPIISSEEIDSEVFEDIDYSELEEAMNNYMIEKAILKWNGRG